MATAVHQPDDSCLLIGRETDRFVQAVPAGGPPTGAHRPADNGLALQRVLRRLADGRAALPAERGGVRTPVDYTYIDCGQYLEACSDLAPDPVSSRLLCLASERQALRAAQDLQLAGVGPIRIIKHQMDYSTGASCGVHINTDHERPHGQIGPLLDSLILALPVLDGPGGLYRDKDGVWFTLNPKGARIRRHTGVDQVASIPLRHHRPGRQLAGNRQRFSFINSYDCFSHSADIFARALQVAAVRLADLGVCDPRLGALAFRRPLVVLRSWMANPFLRLETQSGAIRNAPEMLLSYIDLVLAHEARMPAWVGVLLRSAGDVLELVCRDRFDTQTDHLDWPAKRRLLQSSAAEARLDSRGLLLVPADRPDSKASLLELALLDQVAHDIRPDGLMYRRLRPGQDAFWGFDESLLEKVAHYPPVAPGRPRFIADFVDLYSRRPERGHMQVAWVGIIDRRGRSLELPDVRGFDPARLGWQSNQGQMESIVQSWAPDPAPACRPGQRVVIVGPPSSAGPRPEWIGTEATVESVTGQGLVVLAEHPDLHWPGPSLLPAERPLRGRRVRQSSPRT